MARQAGTERGEGRAGLIIALIIVAFAVFAGIKFVPVYVAAYDLRETIRDEVRLAARSDDRHIETRIVEKGVEHGLPINVDNVEIRRTHNKIIVKVDLDVPIDLALFTFNYNISHEETAPLF